MKFADYFNEDYLLNYFEEHLHHKKGGAWDGMNGNNYKKCGMLSKDLPKIKDKCLRRQYEFTTYAEKLLLKGSNKLPRVISIPTMRDRLTLGVLQSYLKNELGLKYKLNPPACYVESIKKELDLNTKGMCYAKIDFSDFYGSINHATLTTILLSCVKEYEALHLILGAIQTKTASVGSKSGAHEKVQKGLPQGLPISNFLAAKYMEAFDEEMKNAYGQMYVRYVDDIMVLVPSIDDAKLAIKKIEQLNKDMLLGLIINKEKTAVGRFVDKPEGVDFLGYCISERGISVRESTLRHFEKKLVEQCVRLKKGYEDSGSRPAYLVSDNVAYLKHLELEMRITISGIKIRNRLYGWLPYFRNITDVALLFRLDRIVNRILLDGGIKIEVASFVKSYYDLKHGGKKCLVDLDKCTNVAEMEAFLSRKGILSPIKPYSDEQIAELFKRVVGNILKKQKKDISYNS